MATKRGSWYGNYAAAGFHDPTDNNAPAGGVANDKAPQIAVNFPNDRATLGGYYLTRSPKGKLLLVLHGERGPNDSGRIDFNGYAAHLMGYGPNDFPTDSAFKYRYLGKNKAAAVAEAARRGAIIAPYFGTVKTSGVKAPVSPAQPSGGLSSQMQAQILAASSGGGGGVAMPTLAKAAVVPVGSVPLPTQQYAARQAPGAAPPVPLSGAPVPKPQMTPQLSQAESTLVPVDPQVKIDVPKPTPSASGSGQTVPMTEGGKVAVAWALSKLGTKETGANRGKVVDAIEQKFGMVGQAWCGAFVGYGANKAGAKLTNRVVYVPNVVADARAGTNGFSGWSSDYRKAKVGDVVVLYGGSHVGLVTGLTKDGLLKTVEGNTSVRSGGEGVETKTHGADDITGIAHVRYPGKRR